MSQEKVEKLHPVELSVERIGDKLRFQIDPAALARAGSCCNCNTDALALANIGRIAAERLAVEAKG